jgi:hypothetical protein
LSDFVKNPVGVLELALISQRFSRPPSEYWGLQDPALALDFDRLHSLRLQYYENQIAKTQADAMKGENRSIEDQVFTSGEGIKFPMPKDDGPYPGEILEGVRSQREM